MLPRIDSDRAKSKRKIKSIKNKGEDSRIKKMTHPERKIENAIKNKKEIKKKDTAIDLNRKVENEKEADKNSDRETDNNRDKDSVREISSNSDNVKEADRKNREKLYRFLSSLEEKVHLHPSLKLINKIEPEK